MMRGPFFMSLGLHAAIAVAMIWASQPSEGEHRPLPDATMVKLLRPKGSPSSAQQVLPPKDETEAPQEPSRDAMRLPDKTKKDKVEEPVKEPVKVPPPDVPRRQQTTSAQGMREGFEFKGKFGSYSLSGSELGEYDFYLSNIQSKLDQNFRPPTGARAGAVAVVVFTIEKNGSVSQVQLAKPSGNRLLDMAAERAVRAAGRFGPLPAKYEKGQLTINVEFAVSNTAGG